MIVLSALMMLQATAPATGTHFVCEKRNGDTFTIAVPAGMASQNPVDAQRALYHTDIRDDLEAPDTVINGLPEMLSLIWTPEDGSETTLDLIDYDPDTGRASYRLRRQSSADDPIVTTTFFDGRCRTREAGSGAPLTGGRIAQ